MKIAITYIFIILGLVSYTQEQCLFTKVINDQIANAQNPQTVLDEIEASLNVNYIHTKSSSVIKIPIVFHIVHNGDAEGVEENLSDSLIKEQVKRINEDFRAKNFDTTDIPIEFKSFLADTEIEFCLAKVKPNGDFTNGIIHHQLSEDGWDEDTINSYIKPLTIWDRDEYLNVWSLKFAGNLAINHVNGYATPPLSSTDSDKDGVVMNYTKMGNDIDNDIGRILVHEIGHWLGLYHIWGTSAGCASDDGIADTPNQETPHQNCTTTSYNSCNSNDMYMNYLDYTDAKCSLMFTEGQKTKMLSVLNNYRQSILNSDGCNVKDLVIEEIISPSGSVCQEYFLPTVKIYNIGTEDITNYGFDVYIDNVFLSSISVNTSISPNETVYLNNHIFLTSELNINHQVKFIVTTTDADEYNLNNEESSVFKLINTGNGFNDLSEDFETIGLSSSSFFIENNENDNTWMNYSGSTNKVAFINNSGSTIGNIDAFSTTDYDMFSEQSTEPILYFDYLYKAKTGFDDELTVSYSLDCGVHWIPIWKKKGLGLSNNIIQDSPLYYSTEKFKTEEISLFSNGEPNLNKLKKIRFRFENKSAGGNNLYIDNINFSIHTAIKDVEFKDLKIYPNPANNFITISQEENRKLSFVLIDFSGKIIFTRQISKKNEKISLENITKGIYLLKYSNNKSSAVQKIIIE